MSQQGSISQNDLMKKLVQAKKVMNKVDGGNYERGHVNESMLLNDPEEYIHTNDMPALSTTRNVSTPAARMRFTSSVVCIPLSVTT